MNFIWILTHSDLVCFVLIFALSHTCVTFADHKDPVVYLYLSPLHNVFRFSSDSESGQTHDIRVETFLLSLEMHTLTLSK